MTEGSAFWDGTTLGDAAGSIIAAPYSSSEFKLFMYGLFGAPITINGLSSLVGNFCFVSTAEYGAGAGLVTGTSSPVSIAAMHAFVIGNYYVNNSAASLVIPTPAANPRLDYVVLEANWTTQTIRIARVAGAEAATPSPPALTQTNGTLWQYPIAQVYITTGGVITVRDLRVGYQGLSPQTLFRDINGRVFEEFFDNFAGAFPTGAGAGGNWFGTLTSGTLAAAGGESAVQMNTTATGARNAQLSYGNAPGAVWYPLELSKAPILFEARMAFSAAFDANSIHAMRINSAAGGMIQLGMIGSVSTTALVLQGTNGGTTSFTTGQAGDNTGAYHTYGIYLAASGGPAVAFYDGVAIGQIAANLPASTTDVTAQFFVQNGATAADRVLKVDWARWVRGAN